MREQLKRERSSPRTTDMDSRSTPLVILGHFLNLEEGPFIKGECPIQSRELSFICKERSCCVFFMNSEEDSSTV